MERLAVAAAQAVGVKFAGVDILVGTQGEPMVLEVNSMPAWSGLQNVSRIDIAGAVAAELMAELASRPAVSRNP
jgi:glutathione synthase/RimK-type ligase-like ATP-grasp enzyme